MPAQATNPDDEPERGPYAIPIRSCSRWGLPCRSCCQSRGALLPHPFTVAGPKPSPSALCGTFPGVAPAGRYPAPSFRGARTFLGAFPCDAAARPSGGISVARVSRARKRYRPRPSNHSSPCGFGKSRASRIDRHSPSISPSSSSGRKRRWKATTAASLSDTS